jgi:hypothetical protein
MVAKLEMIPTTINIQPTVWVCPTSKAKLPTDKNTTAIRDERRAARTRDLDKLPLRPNPRESMLAASDRDESIASSRTGITVPAIEPSPLLLPRSDLAFRTLCRLEIICGARFIATEIALAIS